MSVESRRALVAELRRRVAAREAQGVYADVALSAAAEPQAPRTPVDDLLQTGRPLLDRAAGGSVDGMVPRARKLAGRMLAPARSGWFEEQRAFEARLREAMASLSAHLEDERRARERAEEDLRALARRVETAERADRLHAAVEALTLRVTMLENRAQAEVVQRAVRREGEPAGASGGGGIPPLEDFDYLAFENRFRGPEEEVRSRQARHAARLAAGGLVADLGCGRGEFLELLRARGIEGVGVDMSAQMVVLAREKGLNAEHGDIFAWLAAREPGSLGGILCSHVVEHLWPADHLRLARLCAAALRPRGVLIIETPNPKSLIAGTVNFPCDPTHVRPVFPETMAFMLETTGFEDVRIEYLSPVPEDRRANPVRGAPAEMAGLVDQVNEAIQRLDDLVFGERDYAVVARRAGT